MTNKTTLLFYELRCEQRHIRQLYPEVGEIPLSEQTPQQQKALTILHACRGTIQHLLDGGEIPLEQLESLLVDIQQRKAELIAEIRREMEAPDTERNPAPDCDPETDEPLFI